MSDDLNKLLGEYENSKKRDDEKNAEENKNMKEKQDAFITEYKELLKTVIQPTIKAVKESLTSFKHTFASPPASIHDKYPGMTNVFSNIIQLKSKRSSVQITIAGNQFYQQVWIDITYLNVRRATKNEVKLSLSDINEGKIKEIYTEAIKALMTEN